MRKRKIKKEIEKKDKMMIKTISIEKIINNKEVYPRNKQDWKVAYKYAESMKAGAQFPPIMA